MVNGPAAAQQQADPGTAASSAPVRRLDRRSFFGGAVSAAVVATVASESAASAHAGGEVPQIIGSVPRHASPRSMKALLDDGSAVRVVLAPEGRVDRDGHPATLGDFEVGDWFLALGEARADGVFIASRVIPGALGAKKSAAA